MPRAEFFFGVRQNGDSTGEGICFQHYWTKLCIFDVYVFAFLCYFIFVLSMYFVELSHASHVLIFDNTHELHVRWGTSSLSYNF